MPITTRRLLARDKDHWLQLFQGYIEFYRSEVPAEVRELTFARLLAADDQVGVVAVDDDDRPVGLAHLLFHRSTWSPTCYCYLEDLFVDPAMRGAGAGRLLMSAVRDEAAARHATRLHWTTQTGNATARQLYDTIATVAPFVQYRVQL
jgi:GNAT superfamily N-acetyltransferase